MLWQNDIQETLKMETKTKLWILARVSFQSHFNQVPGFWQNWWLMVLFDDFKSFWSLGTDEFGVDRADRATPWPSTPSRPSSQWTRTRIRFETDKNFFWPVGILSIAKKYRRPVSTTWICQISFWWCHLGFQFWPSCLVVSGFKHASRSQPHTQPPRPKQKPPNHDMTIPKYQEPPTGG